MGGPERLTHLDASFLYLERASMPMHAGGVSILDPSTRPDGRLPFEDVRRMLAARIHLAPRLRQRVLEVPLGIARPVWVDDERFDLDFHLRRAALPAPGGRAELADAVGRALSEPLDRTRPLWELYLFEGLEGGLAAALLKVHHAMADGVSVMRVAQAMFDLDPEPRDPGEPEPWRPAPPPTAAGLLGDALLQ
ncbi:MAG TPA: wax ester/triacylglycerol synthase domain-containing protein, partial [Actinomycetota bacterium]|nr:wax ester/triacylglycerol synthase domain-containing protein [Actinomycetota bacterium]